MGIYKVEIFCPRRVRIVSVEQSANTVVSNDGDAGSPTPEPSSTLTASPLASNAKKQATAVGNEPSTNVPVDDSAEVIVTTKSRCDEDGQVHKVDVTYLVAEMDPKQIEGEPGDSVQPQASAASNVTNTERGVTFNASVQNTSVSSSAAANETNKELNIEEELRELLLEALPGVRVTWNRCNSLRNMKSDNLETMSTSFLEVAFYVKRRTAMHIVSRVLDEIGIGKDFGRVSMFPVEFFRPMLHNRVKRSEGEDGNSNLVTDISAMLQFEELVDSVDAGAQLNFDFFAFLLIAGIIAGTGLATNSAVSTVASMLVSPMMGPILATVLGTVLVLKGHNKTSEKNRRKAIRLLLNGFGVEFFCLVFCVLLGFVMGFCFWSFRDTFDWGNLGTSEMQARTTVSSLFIGIIIAVPSGAGVALSLLGKNGNSLVGVAIAASLLPPSVNCGLYLSFAIMKRSSQLARMGAYSLSLTLINVACIYFSALLTFYLKHALPRRDSDGRPIDKFFGVEGFDVAARGTLAGKDEATTEAVKAEFSALMMSPGRRTVRTMASTPTIKRTMLSSPNPVSWHQRSASQIVERTIRGGGLANDSSSGDESSSSNSPVAADGDVDFVPNRNDTFLIPVIRPLHRRTRSQPF